MFRSLFRTATPFVKTTAKKVGKRLLNTYGYLMLDLHPQTPVTLRLRSNILPLSQTYPVVYVNKKTHKTNDPLAVDCS